MSMRLFASALALLLAGAVSAAQRPSQGTVTTGEVPGTNCGIVTRCTSGLTVNFNQQICGTVVAPDRSQWPVPSAVHEGLPAVDVFGNAQFIWTRNLLLDNLVLSRYVAQAPAK